MNLKLSKYRDLLVLKKPSSPMIGNMVIDTITNKRGMIVGHTTSEDMDVTIAYEAGYRINIPIKEFLDSFNFIQQ